MGSYIDGNGSLAYHPEEPSAAAQRVAAVYVRDHRRQNPPGTWGYDGVRGNLTDYMRGEGYHDFTMSNAEWMVQHIGQ